MQNTYRQKEKEMISQERFMSHVEMVTESGCWIWTSALNGQGYGHLGWSENGKQVTRGAHRFSYELHKGQIPTGLTIDHLCYVRNCVKPEHLEAVTHEENLSRARGRKLAS
jgi:hypothetical protein